MVYMWSDLLFGCNMLLVLKNKIQTMANHVELDNDLLFIDKGIQTFALLSNKTYRLIY